MAKNQIVGGLDVGTSHIKALVAQRHQDAWEVLHYAQIPSFGLRRGAVDNIDETAKNIHMLLSGVERDCGKKIHSVFVNIGGSHLYTTPSDGLISVSRADHIISEEDVDRVLQATRAISHSSNEEILDVFPREFIIDEQRGIKQPLGLIGVRLEAKVVLLCYFAQYFTNLSQAVLHAGLQIDDIIPSPLAAAEAVLTRQQKEIGAAVIDIGHSTTSLAVFDEGDLIHMAVFPIGSANITNDIAIGLKTDVAIAEEIKKQHGAVTLAKNDKEKKGAAAKKIEIFESTHSLAFTKKQLVDIIGPRVIELLDLMQKELKKIGRQELLPGGVILTGGGAKLPHIKELAKEVLGLPCDIGVPKGIAGLENDPALATVAGLILGGVNVIDEGEESVLANSLGFLKGWGSKMRRMLRVFIP